MEIVNELMQMGFMEWFWLILKIIIAIGCARLVLAFIVPTFGFVVATLILALGFILDVLKKITNKITGVLGVNRK